MARKREKAEATTTEDQAKNPTVDTAEPEAEAQTTLIPEEVKPTQAETAVDQVKTDPDADQQTTQTEDAEQTADLPDELAELRQSLIDYGVSVAKGMKDRTRALPKEEVAAMESLCNLYETLCRTDKSRL